MLTRRRGHTLLETIVALTLGSVVVALGAAFAFRQQRFHRDVAVLVERTEQIEQVAAMMPIALRAIAPGEGDIAPGGARDTSLDFRATIGSGVACDTTRGSAVLAPAGFDPALTSMLARPELGDTAWTLATDSIGERWIARRVTGVADTTAICFIGGTATFGLRARASLVLRLSGGPPLAPAAALRITRRWRYSLYRAADGAWYVGAKEWNASLARFNTIQPVAGPFASASAAGLRFLYRDSLGGSIAAGTPDTRRIALIEIALRIDSARPGSYSHVMPLRGGTTAAVALRNRLR